MIGGEFDAVGDHTPDELRVEYESLLTETIDHVGVDTVVDETDVERDEIEGLITGEPTDLTVADAANIIALDEHRPPAEIIEAEARDILLVGMTTAVLDVETLSSGIDDVLDPKEIQQKIEGRRPMTLSEYATLHQYIEQRSP